MGKLARVIGKPSVTESNGRETILCSKITRSRALVRLRYFYSRRGILLALVFALADLFEDGEPSLLGIGKGGGFQHVRRAEAGDEFSHRTFAAGTLGEFGGTQRPAQRELAAARGAASIAQFIFVEWHKCEMSQAESMNGASAVFSQAPSKSCHAMQAENPRRIFASSRSLPIKTS